jgi:hypothetical protein
MFSGLSPKPMSGSRVGGCSGIKVMISGLPEGVMVSPVAIPASIHA